MKMNKLAIVGFGLMTILLIAACAPQTVDTPANVEQPVENTTVPSEEPAPVVEEPEATATTEDAAVSAEIDMQAFIEGKVNGNHELGRIFNATKTREEWETTLDRMIGYGAKISEDEKQMIIDYLLSQ
ncbi:MAG: hypothetical protein JEZ00_12455 [Anaerolineaceae bacterium]|nr:hypothetical protein [Anaerolineaceae bacterium]